MKPADGKFVAVGSLEPQFYDALCDTLGVGDDPDFQRQNDQTAWPAMRRKLAMRFRSETRAYWTKIFDSVDACVAPVLTMDEAADDGHNAARKIFIDVGGVRQPAPAPRYSHTLCQPPAAPRNIGEDQQLLQNLTDRDGRPLHR